MIDPNKPAFPVNGQERHPLVTGLTIRAHFAAMAMQGILAGDTHEGDFLDPDYKRTDGNNADVVAVRSVKWADALIAALNAEPKP